MDFEEFKEQFAEDVKNDLEGKGIDASVKVNTVEKMNENYDALTVTPEGSNVGVNLNMNKFFEAYDSGDVDYDQVVDKAVTVIREGFENKPEIDVNALTDYEQMKDKLVMEVVSAETNADMLKCIGETDIDKTYEMSKSVVTYRKPRRLSDEQREAARIRIESVNNRKSLRNFLF